VRDADGTGMYEQGAERPAKGPDSARVPAAPRGASGRGRRLCVRIAQAALLVLIAEGWLQLFHRVSSGDWLFRRIAIPIYVSDEYCGWRVKPNLNFRHTRREFSVEYITNAQGFRTGSVTRLYARPKPEGVYRILLMGPSHAFGWANSYEDTFGSCLERSLASTSELEGLAVEVINAAVPSLAWMDQYRWYEQVGRTYEPDLLIVAHYGDMRYYDSPDAPPRYRVNEYGYLVTATTKRWPLLRMRAKQSAIIYNGYLTYQRISAALKDYSSRSRKRGERPADVRVGFNPHGKGVTAFRQRLEAFRDSAASEGRKIMLVHIPMAYTVHRKDAGQSGRLGDLQVQDVINTDAAACRYLHEATGVPCLDLIEPFQTRASRGTERLYYRLDPHFTPLGNRVAVEAVAETIRGSILAR